jgi:branched-chain amino acid transport system ATP-binding protein
MTVLSVQSVSAGYGDVVILRDITLTVETGARVALVGSNGAGKSTLVKAINGLVPLCAGAIGWDGAQIGSQAAAARTRAGIATVPEGRMLFPDLSVTENLLAASTFPRARARREQSLEQTLQLFPRLRERAGQRVGTLSGGEQQMVAIGRALMTCPQLLILDEPSIGLAPKIVNEIFDVLSDLSAQGLSLLLVEQNVTLSLQFADDAHVLQQGRITLSGKADALAQDPQVRAAYMGQAH